MDNFLQPQFFDLPFLKSAPPTGFSAPQTQRHTQSAPPRVRFPAFRSTFQSPHCCPVISISRGFLVMSETYNDNVSKPISSTVKNGGIVALAIAAGAAVAVPIAQKWEGYNGKVNRDPAGYLEQCYGDRNIDPSRIYSKDECAAKLRARMAKDYAPLILKCTPSFINAAHDPKAAQVFGSFIDASYNAGPGAVCQGLSPLVNKGNTSAACEMLPRWRVTAKGKFYPGLANRRRDEQLACLKGLT